MTVEVYEPRLCACGEEAFFGQVLAFEQIRVNARSKCYFGGIWAGQIFV
jgi:hypothetical protein